MRRKLFISIDPPEEVKKTLALVKEDFSEIPAKWTKETNVHMTLLFIGHVDDNKVDEIKTGIKKAVKDIEPFEIEIDNISYEPSDSIPPKMIWAKIARSRSLDQLGIKIGIDNDNFFPHITLARVNSWQFAKMDPEEIPMIEMKGGPTFTVESVELMESKVLRGNIKYELLERFELNKK